MRIVIVGAGEVGTFLGSALSNEHDIIFIETDRQKVNLVKDRFDVLVIHGNGDDPDVLKQAELENADIMLAVSGDDRTNILCSLLSHSLGVEKIIARIGDPTYLQYPALLNNEDILILNPGEIIAEKFTTMVSAPFAWRTEKLAMGQFQMFKLKIEEGAPVVEKKLSELAPAKAWIFVAVSRKGEISIPTGDTRLRAGDYVFAFGNPSVLDRLKEILGVQEEKVESVVIIGGGNLGTKVASNLAEMGIKVKLIENDPELAKSIAEHFSNIMVFNGDGTDNQTLKEAGVGSADYFIALTGDDENNVLSALLAKNLGAKRSTVLYTKSDYIDVIEAIGVDIAVSVRLSTANEILSLLRFGGVAHLALVEEGKAEVMEFEITNATKILGNPLKDVGFPSGSIIGMAIRGNDVIIPRGDYVPTEGDRVIVFSLPHAVKKVEKMLA